VTTFTEKRRKVYFIRPVGMQGPVKIGCSKAPDGRRITLETWSPFPLEIVAEIDGCMDDERRFHSLFRHQHKSREWFDWSPELQSVIDAINCGTFDLSSLPTPTPFCRTKRQRDVSIYHDPAWRFTRSVDLRLSGARKRGASREEISALLGMETWDFISKLRHRDNPDIHALRNRALEALNELDRRYPPNRKRFPLSLPESLAA
jgi:hypothetical protein